MKNIFRNWLGSLCLKLTVLMVLTSQVKAACYVNSETHLPYVEACHNVLRAGIEVCRNSAANPTPICKPTTYAGERFCYTEFPSQDDVFASCGPGAKNSDLTWLPNQAVRRALFDSNEVQNTADGCESYGHLLKAECNPGFPVLTIYYDPNGNYKIESFVVERDPLLNASPDLSAGIRSYIQTRLKMPSGTWTSETFLKTVKMPTEAGVETMDITQYVDMMNVLYQKYPTLDYRQAYRDYINGDSVYYTHYVANYEVLKKALNLTAISIINSLLVD